MSEYIISDMSLSAISTPNLQMIKYDGYMEMFCSESYLCDRYPEIVRCRDCKWYGHDEERYAGLGCIRVGYGSPTGKMPDGFCAWGERYA